jgi:hypothetical protein
MLLAGETVRYARRVVGRHYEPAEARGVEAGVPNVTLVCGNALDPPLLCDALCASGGELILASPYAWQSSLVDDAEAFGGADPAAELTSILRSGRDLRSPYRIEDEAEVPWTLRRDARSEVLYRVHYLRARRER